MTENEIKEAIRDYDPIPILDFPKIPYKSILIIFLLFFSSILFIYTGVVKFNSKDKWYHWFSYMLLGVLLFFVLQFQELQFPFHQLHWRAFYILPH